jgi:hypothetical protein
LWELAGVITYLTHKAQISTLLGRDRAIPVPVAPLNRVYPRKLVTLIAGFRCRNNGILLCADREENDGVSKRAVDKIHRIRREQGWVFVGGAGTVGPIARLNEALEDAITEQVDLVTEHRGLIYKTFELLNPSTK